jgi:hypothetical protein
LVFLDESGFTLTPLVRRTPAPRGRTPVLPCWDRRTRVSAISAITLSPVGNRPGIHFWLLPDHTNMCADHVVTFPHPLRQALPRFTVIWDRSPTHRPFGQAGVIRPIQVFHSFHYLMSQRAKDIAFQGREAKASVGYQEQ